MLSGNVLLVNLFVDLKKKKLSLVKVKRGQKNSEAIRDSIVEGMNEKKALDVVIIDIKSLFNPLADYLIICIATSDKHAEAISDEVEKTVFKNQKENPWVSEGKDLNEWIILDYVNVMAHVFLEEKRNHFALEELWADGKVKRIESKKEEEITERTGS